MKEIDRTGESKISDAWNDVVPIKDKSAHLNTEEKQAKKDERQIINLLHTNYFQSALDFVKGIDLNKSFYDSVELLDQVRWAVNDCLSNGELDIANDLARNFLKPESKRLRICFEACVRLEAIDEADGFFSVIRSEFGIPRDYEQTEDAKKASVLMCIVFIKENKVNEAERVKKKYGSFWDSNHVQEIRDAAEQEFLDMIGSSDRVYFRLAKRVKDVFYQMKVLLNQRKTESSN